MARHQVAEFEWETEKQRIHVRTQAACVMPALQPVSAPAAAPVSKSSEPSRTTAPAGAPSPGPSTPSNAKQVLSPFVGTFYSSPSPTSDPYVQVGQMVKKGDVLCIVEAMKLMNEIESDYNGKVVAVLVENGQPVEFNEPLFLIET